MSNRTLIELNHDYCPRNAEQLEMWATQMQMFMHSGDKKLLPDGVTFKNMRHHSEPCPLEPSATPKVQEEIIQEFCRLARLSRSGKYAKIFQEFLTERFGAACAKTGKENPDG